jgi:hypothetical protein
MHVSLEYISKFISYFFFLMSNVTNQIMEHQIETNSVMGVVWRTSQKAIWAPL